jgi:membrane dipeptidase
MPADELSDRAREIHFSALVFDTHADTPQRLLFDQFDLGHRDAEGCVDIPRVREGGIDAIVFALWVPVHITGPAATARASALLESVLRQIEAHRADLALATSSAEVKEAREHGKIAILLGIEGGHAIDNSLDVLHDFYMRGVRTMTLTHNAATEWADSCTDAARHHGLTDFGKQVVREMNRLGMLIDVSHVSDATFYDVVKTTRAPVIASHSCCRALCNVPRNLDDDMIRALAATGGVVHVAFHNAFLSQEYANAARSLASESALRDEAARHKFGQNEARKLMEGQRWSDESIRSGKLPQVGWEKILDHIEHAVSLVGADHVGLGSDFDGAFMPSGLEDASKYGAIAEGLLWRGHREADIRKILGENALRALADAERLAAAGRGH